LLWLLSVGLAHAQNLPSAKPEEVGLSSERLNRAFAAVKADVDKGALPADHLGTRIKPGPSYLPGPGFGFGLGFAVRTATGEAPSGGSVGEYNWSGAAGTTFWIDPKEDMFVVFMIQDPKQGRHYRALLKDMIYAAVDKPAAK
jgi:CubicO group peptidase (beta-lactamase class C family)